MARDLLSTEPRDLLAAINADPEAEAQPLPDEDFTQKLLSGNLDQLNFALQGASFGFADNARALIEAAPELFDQSNVLGADDRDFSAKLSDFWGRYDESTEEQKQRRDQFAAENPGEALLYELAGGLMVPGVAAAKLGVKGAQTVGQAALRTAGAGAIEGGIYGAGTGLESEDPLWKSVLQGSAMGTVGGAALGAAGKVVGTRLKAWKAVRTKMKTEKKAHQLMDDVDDLVMEVKATNPNLGDEGVMQRVSDLIPEDVSPEMVENALTASGRQVSNPTPRQVAFIQAQKRALEEGTTPSKWKARTDEFRQLADDIGGALATRVGIIDQEAFNMLKKHDYRLHSKQQAYLSDLSGAERLNMGRHKETKRQVKKLLVHNKFDEALKVMRATGDEELANGFQSAQRVYNEIRAELSSVGYDIAQDSQYFARVVKDVGRLRSRLNKQQKGQMDTAIDRATKAKNVGKSRGDEGWKELTPREKTNVVNGWLQSGGLGGKGAGQLGHSKARTIEYLSEDLMDEYLDPVEAMTSYVTRAVEDIEERRLFGKHATGGTSSIDVDDTVGAWVSSLEHLDPFQQQDLATLYSTRFGAGKLGPGRFVSSVKNVGLMSALGNPKAAMIQVADLGHSALFNGFRNTAEAMIQSAAGKGAKVGDIGLDGIIQSEFNTARATARSLDRVLRASAFKNIDKFGKETFMNAALNKARRTLNGSQDDLAKFAEKWEPVFGDEFSSTANSLRNGDLTDENVRLFLWHELSGVQPISLSEMPLTYLKMKNGRIVYTLRSFALKQADILRRNVAHEWQKGNKKEAARFALSYAAITGGSAYMTDELRRAIFTGGADPVEFAGDDLAMGIFWHMVAATGFVNRYNLERGAKSGDIVGEVTKGLAPPLGVVGGALMDAAATAQGNPPDSVMESKTVKEIPLIGQLMHGIYGGGFEKVAERKRQEQ